MRSSRVLLSVSGYKESGQGARDICLYFLFLYFCPVWITQHLNKFHPVLTQLLILQSLKLMSDHSALENSIQAHDN